MRTLGKILEALGRGLVATPSLYWTVPMLPPPWQTERRQLERRQIERRQIEHRQIDRGEVQRGSAHLHDEHPRAGQAS